MVYNLSKMHSKVQSQACQCISKETVIKKVQVLKDSIIKVYEEKCSNLQVTINQLQQRVRTLQEMISAKQLELSKMNNEISMQKTEISRCQSQLLSIRQTNLEYDSELKSNRSLIQNLYDRLKLKEKEIADLQADNKSVIQSSYSISSRYHQNAFSIQIGEIFRNKPDEILQFIDSIEGVSIEAAEEQGDMSCVLVGRDNITVEKWINANRTCLRRLIKDNQKRFRFILIHKPGKKKAK